MSTNYFHVNKLISNIVVSIIFCYECFSHVLILIVWEHHPTSTFHPLGYFVDTVY